MEGSQSDFRHSVSRGRMRCFYDCSTPGPLRCSRDYALCKISWRNETRGSWSDQTEFSKKCPQIGHKWNTAASAGSRKWL